MRLGISARQSVGAISRSAGALLSAELAGNCLAMRGRRFVVTDLDLDGNFVVSGSEFALFIYNNLEPIICVVIALLYSSLSLLRGCGLGMSALPNGLWWSGTRHPLPGSSFSATC